MHASARGIITIDEKSILRDIAQGMYRLRNINGDYNKEDIEYNKNKTKFNKV
jgi:hypothetical protein